MVLHRIANPDPSGCAGSIPACGVFYVKMVQSITQEDEMGCSIACVAFAINDSYENAKKLFTHLEHASTKGYYCGSIAHALKKAGLKYSFRKINDENKKLLSKENSIVFIKKDKNYPEGHFLIKTKKGWMDPWINLPKKPRKSGFRDKLPGNPTWIIYKN